VAKYDWLTMMQNAPKYDCLTKALHINLHYIQPATHREHKVVFPPLRPALLLVQQAAKYSWLFVLRYNKSLL
jgi:hypothetical protein